MKTEKYLKLPGEGIQRVLLRNVVGQETFRPMDICQGRIEYNSGAYPISNQHVMKTKCKGNNKKQQKVNGYFRTYKENI